MTLREISPPAKQCGVPRHPSAGTMPTLRPRSLGEKKPAASAITSPRDDELTERRHGYQNYLFSLWTGPKSRTTVEVRTPHVSAVFTTALPGLAPVRPTRASAVNPRKSIALVGVMTWL